MYAKLMEVENAIIDFEKVMALINLEVHTILSNPDKYVSEEELLLLQETFLEKYNNLKLAFYACYDKQSA